jgi:Uma2 family endonuclease
MTVDEYESLVRSGGLKSRNRFHLINGYLVAKMTQNPPRRVADELCGAALARILPTDRYHVAAAKPVRLPGRDSEPEPDRCVVRGTIRDYEDHHPGPGEIALIVEVSDSSLAEDRALAREVYGPAGIPVYWIVDLIHRQVEVHTEPGP